MTCVEWAAQVVLWAAVLIVRITHITRNDSR